MSKSANILIPPNRKTLDSSTLDSPLSQRGELPSDVSIRVTDLWKRYRTGAYQGRTLVKEAQSFFARLQGEEDPNQKIAMDRGDLEASSAQENEWFWAVKGASLEVKKGECVVVLGRNGAGKSTLLQMLCGVTGADQGVIEYQGRFATLLQAGVGFHPELTGRENVFLNGAILGLSRDEIIDRIPAIAEFSEIPQFLDTPVKRYSSGMQGRLGFSVAAHLGAEIMILDEVFATGDRVYRFKCIDKIQELAASGTTILLVTHMVEMLGDAVDRAVYMNDGCIRYDGEKDVAMHLYLEEADTVEEAEALARGEEISSKRDRKGRENESEASAGKLRSVDSDSADAEEENMLPIEVLSSEGFGMKLEAVPSGEPFRLRFDLNYWPVSESEVESVAENGPFLDSIPGRAIVYCRISCPGIPNFAAFSSPTLTVLLGEDNDGALNTGCKADNDAIGATATLSPFPVELEIPALALLPGDIRITALLRIPGDDGYLRKVSASLPVKPSRLPVPSLSSVEGAWRADGPGEQLSIQLLSEGNSRLDAIPSGSPFRLLFDLERLEGPDGDGMDDELRCSQSFPPGSFVFCQFSCQGTPNLASFASPPLKQILGGIGDLEKGDIGSEKETPFPLQLDLPPLPLVPGYVRVTAAIRAPGETKPHRIGSTLFCVESTKDPVARMVRAEGAWSGVMSGPNLRFQLFSEDFEPRESIPPSEPFRLEFWFDRALNNERSGAGDSLDLPLIGLIPETAFFKTVISQFGINIASTQSPKLVELFEQAEAPEDADDSVRSPTKDLVRLILKMPALGVRPPDSVTVDLQLHLPDRNESVWRQSVLIPIGDAKRSISSMISIGSASWSLQGPFSTEEMEHQRAKFSDIQTQEERDRKEQKEFIARRRESKLEREDLFKRLKADCLNSKLHLAVANNWRGSEYADQALAAFYNARGLSSRDSGSDSDLIWEEANQGIKAASELFKKSEVVPYNQSVFSQRIVTTLEKWFSESNWKPVCMSASPVIYQKLHRYLGESFELIDSSVPVSGIQETDLIENNFVPDVWLILSTMPGGSLDSCIEWIEKRMEEGEVNFVISALSLEREDFAFRVSLARAAAGNMDLALDRAIESEIEQAWSSHCHESQISLLAEKFGLQVESTVLSGAPVELISLASLPQFAKNSEMRERNDSIQRVLNRDWGEAVNALTAIQQPTSKLFYLRQP